MEYNSAMKSGKQLKRVLIMAGGTGGHVFPGLAVARYLREQGVDVHWLGTKQGLEARVVPEANIPLHLITIGGLRGKGIKTLLSAPFQMTRALLQSLRLIRSIQPDAVIGMGGFASGPGGLASWLLRKPLLIHEQNAKAGFTNKLLARLAARVLEGFPDAFSPQPKVIETGNPVRTEIANLPPPATSSHPSSRFRLLVIGGSLGAQALNDMLPRTLACLNEQERPEVIHQTGDKHFDTAKKAYESKGIDADIQPFIHDMAKAYGWADLVICRAGALTVAELCAAGKGAIFVPYPHATDDHQTANAQFMVNHQAALCIQQADLSETRLAEILRSFAQTPEKCLAMAQAAYQLRKVNVSERIFAILAEVVGSRT